MQDVLVSIYKLLEFNIEIFLMKKLHNLWYINEKPIESFLGKIFDLRN